MCFKVFDEGVQTKLPWDEEDQYFVFCLTQSREMESWTMTEIYLYCSITYADDCNNSCSLQSSFE